MIRIKISELRQDLPEKQYSIPCLLISVNSKSENRLFKQYYVTDFTHNPKIGPLGNDQSLFYVGAKQLDVNQVLTVALEPRHQHQVCQKLYEAKHPDSKIVYTVPEYMGLFRNDGYQVGVFCEIVVSKIKQFRETLECMVQDVRILEATDFSNDPNCSRLARYVIDHAGDVYMALNRLYLVRILPSFAKMQKNQQISDRNDTEQINHQSSYEIYQEKNKNDSSLPNDFHFLPGNHTNIPQFPKLEELSEFSELINDPQTLQEFDEVAPYSVEELMKNIETIPESKIFVIKGKVVDFNNDSRLVAYKTHKQDLPKLKSVTLTITDLFNDKASDQQEVRDFIITDRNCLKLELDTLDEILEFFQVDEIEELYVRQDQLVNDVYSLISRLFKPIHFHQQTEFRIYKKQRHVHPRFSYPVWGIKGLKMSDLE